MVNLSLPSVSVILPLLNEEQNLQDCIASIRNQDYPGEIEIILALGPSKDKTNEIAKSLADQDNRIKLVENPTGQTAVGLNLAIAKSKFEIICRIDGHSEIESSYIKTAVEIMQKHKAVNVGGLMYADSNKGLQRVIALAMRSKLGVGPSKFHTGGEAGEVDTVYLGVFKRDALLAVGGFDEHFTRAQDWELNYRLRKNGGRIYFDPRLTVTYRPRRSFKALAKQYFEYGRWRRVVSRTHKGTINLRYLAPPITLIGVILSIILGYTHPILLAPALVYFLFLILGSFMIGKSFKEVLYLPMILATMQMSWGAGFITSPKRLANS